MKTITRQEIIPVTGWEFQCPKCEEYQDCDSKTHATTVSCFDCNIQYQVEN